MASSAPTEARSHRRRTRGGTRLTRTPRWNGTLLLKLAVPLKQGAGGTTAPPRSAPAAPGRRYRDCRALHPEFVCRGPRSYMATSLIGGQRTNQRTRRRTRQRTGQLTPASASSPCFPRVFSHSELAKKPVNGGHNSPQAGDRHRRTNVARRDARFHETRRAGRAARLLASGNSLSSPASRGLPVSSSRQLRPEIHGDARVAFAPYGRVVNRALDCDVI